MFPQINLKAHDSCFYSFQNVSNVVLIAMFLPLKKICIFLISFSVWRHVYYSGNSPYRGCHASSGIFVSPCHVFEAVNRLFRLLIKSEIFRYYLELCTAKNRWAIASYVPFSFSISPLDVNYVDISRHHLHLVTTSWLWRISHRNLVQS